VSRYEKGVIRTNAAITYSQFDTICGSLSVSEIIDRLPNFKGREPTEANCKIEKEHWENHRDYLDSKDDEMIKLIKQLEKQNEEAGIVMGVGIVPGQLEG